LSEFIVDAVRMCGDPQSNLRRTHDKIAGIDRVVPLRLLPEVSPVGKEFGELIRDVDAPSRSFDQRVRDRRKRHFDHRLHSDRLSRDVHDCAHRIPVI
jgi:hypothetical protein